MKPQLIFKKIDLAQTPPLMSALGQKRTSRSVEGMSALPPKADIGTQSWNVRFVPKADIDAWEAAGAFAKAVIRSVELIVQPDAHDVVGELAV
jgi:hypothetical protein